MPPSLSFRISRAKCQHLRVVKLLALFALTVSACSSGQNSSSSPQSSGVSVAGAVEELVDAGQDGTSASTEIEQGGEEADTATEAGTTTVVTIEPPPNTAAPIALPEQGCDGAGFGRQASSATRIGVLVPDYRDLIETGFIPRVTPAEYRNRYLATIEGVNGRSLLSNGDSSAALPCGELELVFATYDPIDPDTQRDACLELTSGDGVLVVVAEVVDRRGEAIECLLSEAGVPVVVAGPVTAAELNDGQGRLVSLRAPAELIGRNAVARYAELIDLEAANIAIVGGEGKTTAAATNAIVDELESLGLTPVSVIRLPDDVGTTEVWAEIPRVADGLVAAETTVVISVFDALVNNALWDQMLDSEASWAWLLVDISGVGEHDRVTRLPDEFTGLLVTSLTSQVNASRQDEASGQCISDYASLIDDQQPAVPADLSSTTTIISEPLPTTSEVGVDASEEPKPDESDEETEDGLEVSSRELLGEERPPGPSCALLSVVVAAISEAGVDLNSETLVDGLADIGPIELFIEGTGSLTADKHYVADFTQVLSFVKYVAPVSDELVAPCGSPDNCWRSIEEQAGGLLPILAPRSANG